MEDLPEAIQEWISEGFEMCQKLQMTIDKFHPLNAHIIIDYLNARPSHRDSKDEFQMYIRIRPKTSKADINRIWSLVEMQKLKIWGLPPKKPRKWRTFERDIELTMLYEELNNYDEVIRAYDKKHPDNRIAHYSALRKIIISDDVYDLVRQAVKRTKDRMTNEFE